MIREDAWRKLSKRERKMRYLDVSYRGHILEIEEAKMKKEDDERLAREELERLIDEEYKLTGWKNEFENGLIGKLNEINQVADWSKYSFCEEGYVNIRREKELNGFLHDFKQSCDPVKRLINA
jgi:hypothetical protein